MIMKKLLSIVALAMSAVVLTPNVHAKKFTEMLTPEETGLNVQKITDENNNSVCGSATYKGFSGEFAMSSWGGCKAKKYYWSCNRLLSLSPEGDRLAYVGVVNKQHNIMVRKATAVGASTQRTFRNVSGIHWGNDNKLYYSDITDWPQARISCTNALAGNIMRQLTNNNRDENPVVTKDGTVVFFTRVDKSGPSIWALNQETGELTSCARGFCPAIIGDKKDEFLCVRNSTSGNSEIWLVNYDKGQETLILSDKNRGYTNPQVSPDGQWILCVGNSKSSISKKNNLDIFAVKMDGSNLVQLTYHPADDCSPIWSADGKSVFFISYRTNKDDYFNIWKMRFDLM